MFQRAPFLIRSPTPQGMSDVSVVTGAVYSQVSESK